MIKSYCPSKKATTKIPFSKFQDGFCFDSESEMNMFLDDCGLQVVFSDSNSGNNGGEEPFVELRGIDIYDFLPRMEKTGRVLLPIPQTSYSYIRSPINSWEIDQNVVYSERDMKVGFRKWVVRCSHRLSSDFSFIKRIPQTIIPTNRLLTTRKTKKQKRREMERKSLSTQHSEEEEDEEEGIIVKRKKKRIIESEDGNQDMKEDTKEIQKEFPVTSFKVKDKIEKSQAIDQQEKSKKKKKLFKFSSSNKKGLSEEKIQDKKIGDLHPISSQKKDELASVTIHKLNKPSQDLKVLTPQTTTKTSDNHQDLNKIGEDLSPIQVTTPHFLPRKSSQEIVDGSPIPEFYQSPSSSPHITSSSLSSGSSLEGDEGKENQFSFSQTKKGNNETGMKIESLLLSPTRIELSDDEEEDDEIMRMVEEEDDDNILQKQREKEEEEKQIENQMLDQALLFYQWNLKKKIFVNWQLRSNQQIKENGNFKLESYEDFISEIQTIDSQEMNQQLRIIKPDYSHLSSYYFSDQKQTFREEEYHDDELEESSINHNHQLIDMMDNNIDEMNEEEDINGDNNWRLFESIFRSFYAQSLNLVNPSSSSFQPNFYNQDDLDYPTILSLNILLLFDDNNNNHHPNVANENGTENYWFMVFQDWIKFVFSFHFNDKKEEILFENNSSIVDSNNIKMSILGVELVDQLDLNDNVEKNVHQTTNDIDENKWTTPISHISSIISFQLYSENENNKEEIHTCYFELKISEFNNSSYNQVFNGDYIQKNDKQERENIRKILINFDTLFIIPNLSNFQPSTSSTSSLQPSSKMSFLSQFLDLICEQNEEQQLISNEELSLPTFKFLIQSSYHISSNEYLDNKETNIQNNFQHWILSLLLFPSFQKDKENQSIDSTDIEFIFFKNPTNLSICDERSMMNELCDCISKNKLNKQWISLLSRQNYQTWLEGIKKQGEYDEKKKEIILHYQPSTLSHFHSSNEEDTQINILTRQESDVETIHSFPRPKIIDYQSQISFSSHLSTSQTQFENLYQKIKENL